VPEDENWALNETRS